MPIRYPHRAMQLVRDPGGAAELTLLPGSIAVELRLVELFSEPTGDRIRDVDGATFPRLVRGGLVEVEIRMEGEEDDQYDAIRQDAEAGTVRAYRLTWTPATPDDDPVVQVDLPELMWEPPEAGIADGQIERLSFAGRALGSATATLVYPMGG